MDDATGFTAPPARYLTEGRETIDRIRDAARGWATQAAAFGLDGGDAAFYVHCRACELKYADREGKKGDPTEDAQKARWYRMMADHLLGDGPDPRAYREGGHAPYVRPA